MKAEQKRNLAERCHREPNNSIFIPSYVIKRYSEFTHTYPSHAKAKEIISSYYEEYEKEFDFGDF